MENIFHMIAELEDEVAKMRDERSEATKAWMRLCVYGRTAECAAVANVTDDFEIVNNYFTKERDGE